MLRRSLSVAFGLLAIFHVCVLAAQAWDGQLADPGLVVRWAVGAGLALALTRRWQRREAIFTGRVPVALWLLAALLHGPAVFDGHVDQPGQAPEPVAVAVQVAAAATASVLGLGIAFALLGLGWRLRRSPAVRLRRAVPPRLAARALVARLRVAPRPPPLLRSPLSFA